jgi:hypothetical protein
VIGHSSKCSLKSGVSTSLSCRFSAKLGFKPEDLDSGLLQDASSSLRRVLFLFLFETCTSQRVVATTDEREF